MPLRCYNCGKRVRSDCKKCSLCGYSIRKGYRERAKRASKVLKYVYDRK